MKLYAEYKTSGGVPYQNIYPRLDEALNTAEVLVLDIDKNGMEPEETHKLLEHLNLNHFIYSSASDRPEDRRYRVVIPCFMQEKAQLAPSIVALRAKLLEHGFHGEAGGSEETNWAIPWYMPTVTESGAPFTFLSYMEGEDYIAEDRTVSTNTVAPAEPSNTVPNKISLDTMFTGGAGYFAATRSYAYFLAHTGGVSYTQASYIMDAITRNQRENPARGEILDRIKDIPRLLRSAFNTTSQDWADPTPLPLDMVTTVPRPNFPIECLPKTLRDGAEAIADFTETKIEFAACAAVGMVSAALNAKVMIHELKDHAYPSAMGMVLLMDTSARKSPVFSRLKQPFKRAEEYLRKLHGEKTVLNEARFKEAEKKLKGLVEEIEEEGGEANYMKQHKLVQSLKPKTTPQLYVDDVTDEELKSIGYRQCGSMAVLTDECISVFDNIMGQYSKNVKLGAYLHGFVYGEVRVNRKNPDSPAISYNLNLNMVSATQPYVWGKFIGNRDIIKTGIASRFLPVYVSSNISNRKPDRNRELDVKKMKAYDDLVFKLAVERPNATYGGNTLTVKPGTHVYLDDNAGKLWEEFAGYVNKGIDEGGDLYQYRDVLGKIVSTSATIGNVFLACTFPDMLKETTAFIDEDIYRDAIIFTKFLMGQIKSTDNVSSSNAVLFTARRLVYVWANSVSKKSMQKGVSFGEFAKKVTVKLREDPNYQPALVMLKEYGILRMDFENNKIYLSPYLEKCGVDIYSSKFEG